MKKYAFFAILGVGAVMFSFSASAAGFHMGFKAEGRSQMIADKASVLGISEDVLKSKLSEGKTFLSIIQEQGMTQEQFQTKMQEKMKLNLEQMVKDGKITQAQIDAHLSRQKDMQAKMGNLRGGMGRGHFKFSQ
jgi:cobalamin biosynthesis protein CbiD